jgi:tRNA threonylcarbamoyladenosine biosynthesis protein TsaB
LPAITNKNPIMKLLAIDTVTEACSAALLVDGEIQQRFTIEPRRHTELILPMIDELLGEAGLSLSQLDALAVDRGPGSFTGVRIGVGVVQGLAFAADLPVYPVSSLAALALAASQEITADTMLAMLDARMDEIYWGVYRLEHGLLKSVMDEQVGKPDSLPLLSGNILCTGSGARLHEASLAGQKNYHFIQDCRFDFPHASFVAQLAIQCKQEQAVTAAELQPVYLRNLVATPCKP